MTWNLNFTPTHVQILKQNICFYCVSLPKQNFLRESPISYFLVNSQWFLICNRWQWHRSATRNATFEFHPLLGVHCFHPSWANHTKLQQLGKLSCWNHSELWFLEPENPRPSKSSQDFSFNFAFFCFGYIPTFLPRAFLDYLFIFDYFFCSDAASVVFQQKWNLSKEKTSQLHVLNRLKRCCFVVSHISHLIFTSLNRCVADGMKPAEERFKTKPPVRPTWALKIRTAEKRAKSQNEETWIRSQSYRIHVFWSN